MPSRAAALRFTPLFYTEAYISLCRQHYFDDASISRFYFDIIIAGRRLRKLYACIYRRAYLGWFVAARVASMPAQGEIALCIF